MRDVFISYNHRDRAQVEPIAAALRDRGLSVWLDVWELRLGFDWLPGVQKGLMDANAVLVFVAGHGLGAWESDEYQGALLLQKKRGHPVIPVKLSGFPDDGELPVFLEGKHFADLRRGVSDEALDHLVKGITGKAPRPRSKARAVPEPAAPAPELDAIARLVSHLAEDNVTFFLGSRTGHACSDEPSPGLAMASQLLASLKLLDVDHRFALIPPLDVVGSYYAARNGGPNLETAVMRFLLEREASAVPLLDRLATLLLRLAERPRVRGRRRTEQLLISTSPDLAVERALIAQEVPFIRLVQHRSVPRVCINEIRRVQRNGDTVGLTGSDHAVEEMTLDRLDERLVTVGYSEVRGPAELSLRLVDSPSEGPVLLLYKFLGSRDLKHSCALSAEQQLEFMAELLRERAFPLQVQQIVENTPILLLGTGLLDPDFRLAYYTLLEKGLAVNRGVNFALQTRPVAPPDNPNMIVESRLWENLKDGARELNISLLDGRGESFLDTLGDELGRQFAL